MNFYSDVSEWRYLFKNAIDWDTIIPLYKSGYPTSDGFKDKDELLAFYEELLTVTGKWAGDTLSTRARELDKTGGGKLVDGKIELSEVLKKSYQEAIDMDLLGMNVDPKFGGMGIPVIMGLLGFQQICRACLSTSTQLAFFTSIADMIERFCDKNFQDTFIPRIVKGQISGSMCLTEPNAGSDLAKIRTSAQKLPNGTYLLNGSKCFITNGGGGLGFVLARTQGAPEGLDGISIFFAEENHGEPNSDSLKQNYRITKVEEKMGLHGSLTCEVVYENSIAHLVGKENEGFKIMLHLMNEARISVGLQGLGGMEASVYAAEEYAKVRYAFGKPLIELPLFKRNLDDWKTEVDAFRALMVDTISHFDIFQRLDLKKRHASELNQKETELFKKASRVIRRRTPLVKYYGAEAFTQLSQKAIQAFGGYGFMTEYDVERYHRDSFGALLYEGTSQIQALMAMKDFMKVLTKDPAKFIQALVVGHPLGSILSDSDSEKSVRGVSYEFRKNVANLLMKCFKPELGIGDKGLKETISQINQLFKKEYWQEVGRFDKLMTHAETLCQALSYRETLKVLSLQASKDKTRSELYYRYLKLVTPRLAGIYADWKQ